MKLSSLPTKSLRETTKKFDSKSHELLLRGGYVDQVASGIFSFLPLGLRVLNKVENIIRQELNAFDAQEVILPKLQPKSAWETTKRWDSVDVLYRVISKHEHEYALDLSAEEMVCLMAKNYIRSYRDLPLCLYQIGPKFRDEARAKSGILRGREFRMKDAYSFHSSPIEFEKYYEEMKALYLQIYAKMGFTDVKVTEASGGIFSKNNSHEFNVLTPAGEVDLVYYEDETIAYNEEVVTDKLMSDLQKKGEVKKGKAIEIGNIFSLGTKFSKDFDLVYTDDGGRERLVQMGCYGIGTSRILGALVEVSHDSDGIIWPRNVAPFQVHLVNLNKDSGYAGVVYRTLLSQGIEVLYDDREGVGNGEKLTTADFLGIPLRLIVSEKTGKDVEVKERTEEKTHLVTLESLKNLIFDYYQSS